MTKPYSVTIDQHLPDRYVPAVNEILSQFADVKIRRTVIVTASRTRPPVIPSALMIGTTLMLNIIGSAMYDSFKDLWEIPHPIIVHIEGDNCLIYIRGMDNIEVLKVGDTYPKKLTDIRELRRFLPKPDTLKK